MSPCEQHFFPRSVHRRISFDLKICMTTVMYFKNAVWTLFVLVKRQKSYAALDRANGLFRIADVTSHDRDDDGYGQSGLSDVSHGVSRRIAKTALSRMNFRRPPVWQWMSLCCPSPNMTNVHAGDCRDELIRCQWRLAVDKRLSTLPVEGPFSHGFYAFGTRFCHVRIVCDFSYWSLDGIAVKGGLCILFNIVI